MDSTDPFQDSPMSPGGSEMSAPPHASSSSSSSAASKISRGHSCVLCQQRKVKCDRGKPCSNCIKARAECVPSIPSVPRRRRKKIPDTDIAGRLQRCEDLLKKHGIKIEDEDRAISRRDNGLTTMEMDESPSLLELPKDPTFAASQSRYSGTLMSDKGNTHFIENPLWENLREDVHGQEPRDGSSSDDEINGSSLCPDPGTLLIGYTPQKYTLNSQHPPPIQIFRLWQAFLTNVNPLTKLFHAPTVQQIILDASGDLEHVSRPTEALMFSIYLLAVTSMKSEDCQTMLGESQSALLSKYSHATQHALLRATYLRSLSLVTLQAYTLFLFALRKFYDPHSLWVLTGAAVRISQRIGLHHDGSSHDLPPFEAEMRRRLWWQIVFLDGHSSKLSGSGFPAWLARFDTKMPLNVSDSSLSPGMKELPTEHPGPTEMMFCRVRYEVADALRKSKLGQWDGDKFKVATGVELIAQKDRAINELKQRIEEKYLQYCDPSIPLHYLCTLMSKAVICTMRVMAHHPRQYPDKGATMPQAERDMLFSESLDLLEFDRLAHTEKNLEGFLWHIHSHFQMDAFIFMLSELRQRTSGELVERAWRQVGDSYSLHPEMIKDTKNGLFFAVGNLVIKAWENRERTRGRYDWETPSFITQLRSYRKQAEPSLSVNQNFDESFMRTHINPPNNDLPETNVLAATSQFLSGDSSDLEYAFDPNMMEVSPVDWNYWQTLMDGCDLPNLPDDKIQNFFN